MTCPRCGGDGKDSGSDQFDDDKLGKCILRHTKCTACGFGVNNAVWQVSGELQYLGWTSDDPIPNDLPQAIKDGIKK